MMEIDIVTVVRNILPFSSILPLPGLQSVVLSGSIIGVLQLNPPPLAEKLYHAAILIEIIAGTCARAFRVVDPLDSTSSWLQIGRHYGKKYAAIIALFAGFVIGAIAHVLHLLVKSLGLAIFAVCCFCFVLYVVLTTPDM
jgi:hypothetical protein